MRHFLYRLGELGIRITSKPYSLRLYSYSRAWGSVPQDYHESSATPVRPTTASQVSVKAWIYTALRLEPWARKAALASRCPQLPPDAVLGRVPLSLFRTIDACTFTQGFLFNKVGLILLPASNSFCVTFYTDLENSGYGLPVNLILFAYTVILERGDLELRITVKIPPPLFVLCSDEFHSLFRTTDAHTTFTQGFVYKG